MITDTIEVLKEINRQPLRVYLEDGIFADLGVTFYPGLTKEECSKLPEDLPKDYIDLLSFSNGLIFFNSGDCSFNAWSDVQEIKALNDFPENVYPIAAFLDDYVLLVIDKSERGYSLYAGPAILLNEYTLLDYDLSDFIDYLLHRCCCKFWLDNPPEKYYDFRTSD